VYDAIKTISQSAGPLFMEGYTHTKTITYKSAVDLVTEYDVKVELLLKEKLSVAFPEHTPKREKGQPATACPCR
jgi:fructose-1,6-bisphosphatase/inositol monophosphatase family enzyme